MRSGRARRNEYRTHRRKIREWLRCFVRSCRGRAIRDTARGGGDSPPPPTTVAPGPFDVWAKGQRLRREVEWEAVKNQRFHTTTAAAAVIIVVVVFVVIIIVVVAGAPSVVPWRRCRAVGPARSRQRRPVHRWPGGVGPARLVAGREG